jgi:hypothetical protein
MKAGLDRKKLMKEIEQDRRRVVRERLAELRELIKAAQLNRREAVAGVKTQCRVARAKLRTVCARRAAKAKEQGSAAVAARRLERAEVQAGDRVVRRGDKLHATGPSRLRSTRGERRAESDDEVRGNLEPELLKVFEKVKKHIKGGPRKTRTEAFLEWAEENPGEVWSMQSEEAERDLHRMISEHERLGRAHKSSRRLAASDVPF